MTDDRSTQAETDFLPDDTTPENDHIERDILPDEMPPPPSFREKQRSYWKDHKYLLACFFVPAAIMLLIHIAMGVWPFGEESVLVLDLNGQYVFYFEELRDLLRGDGSFIYSFERALGGEFLGIVAYYLASPFSFIVALFPEGMITESLLTLFVLKTGLCGLTFGIYLHNTHKRNPVVAVIFSTLYALTAYAVVYQHNTMWIDNVFFLPLILLGIESMIKYGKYKLFVITLSLAVISNFYIGYMTCIFVAVYFFYAYFTRTPEERNPLGVRYHFPKSLARIAVFSVIVLLISAIILLPAYYSLTFGKTEFSNPKFGLSQKFDFMDLLSMMYFGSYDTVRPEGLPLVYTSMLTFLLFPLYFFAPHIKTREKLGTGILIAFFVFSFNATTLDLVWHGFQRPNWLNYRYSFMLCFIFILMAYKALEKLREIGYRHVIFSASGIAGILLILQKLDYENLPDLSAVWVSLLFIGVYLCVMRAAASKSDYTRQTASLVLVIVVCLETFCAGYHNLVSLDKDVVVSTRDSYRSVIDRLQPVVDLVKEEDDSFYRMEKTTHRNTNDNFTLGMRGVSNSTSTLNAKVIKFLNQMGIASKSHWSKYVGGTPVFDSLLGIKYLITDQNAKVSPLYENTYTSDSNLLVYKNPYALSIAYGVNKNLSTLDLSDPLYNSPFVRMNYIIGEMMGAEKASEVFKPIEIESSALDNCRKAGVVDHTKYAQINADSDSFVTFTLHAPADGYIYCYFPSEYPREATLVINGNNVGNFFGNDTFAVKTAGPFTAGQKITVALKLLKTDLYLAENEYFFYYLDEEAFKTSMETIGTSQFNIESYTEDSLYGTINIADDQKFVFTSIPYDAGWIVRVDGETVRTSMVLDALLCFEIPSAGEHTLSLEYRPDCVRYGVISCIVGIASFTAIWTAEVLLQRRNPKKGCEL